MRSIALALLTVFLFSDFELGAERSEPSSPSRVQTRLSYHNTFPSEPGAGAHDICFALYDDGSYRLLKIGALGKTALAGTLSQAQATELERALEKLNFQSKGGGLVRQGLEAFRAEVRRQGRRVEYDWVDPDHIRPFPASAEEIIAWLEQFEPRDGVPFRWQELSNWSVCPPATLEAVQPAVAGLSKDQPVSSAGGGPR